VLQRIHEELYPYSENAAKSTVIKQPVTIKFPSIERLTTKGLAQHDLKLNRAGFFS